MPEKRDASPSHTGQDWHNRSCYGCGPDNPHGLKAEFRFDEESGEVRFTYKPRPYQEGAPGFVHGGILASILDEAQGVLCFHVGHTVMTDELHMKYHVATPLDKEFTVRCWLTAVRRRRLYTKATIHSKEGVLLVSARAVWYLLSERLMRRLFQEKFPTEEEARVRAILEANRRRAKEIRRKLRAKKYEEKEPEVG